MAKQDKFIRRYVKGIMHDLGDLLDRPPVNLVYGKLEMTLNRLYEEGYNDGLNDCGFEDGLDDGQPT